jgi:hypothetical protein
MSSANGLLSADGQIQRAVQLLGRSTILAPIARAEGDQSSQSGRDRDHARLGVTALTAAPSARRRSSVSNSASSTKPSASRRSVSFKQTPFSCRSSSWRSRALTAGGAGIGPSRRAGRARSRQLETSRRPAAIDLSERAADGRGLIVENRVLKQTRIGRCSIRGSFYETRRAEGDRRRYEVTHDGNF